MRPIWSSCLAKIDIVCQRLLFIKNWEDASRFYVGDSRYETLKSQLHGKVTFPLRIGETQWSTLTILANLRDDNYGKVGPVPLMEWVIERSSRVPISLSTLVLTSGLHIWLRWKTNDGTSLIVIPKSRISPICFSSTAGLCATSRKWAEQMSPSGGISIGKWCQINEDMRRRAAGELKTHWHIQ